MTLWTSESIMVPLLSVGGEGTRYKILRWLAKQGDFVYAGDDLLEIESEDGSEGFILDSFDTGLVRIFETEGIFPVGHVIGRIDRDCSLRTIRIEMDRSDVMHLNRRRGDVSGTRYLNELVKKILREDQNEEV